MAGGAVNKPRFRIKRKNRRMTQIVYAIWTSFTIPGKKFFIYIQNVKDIVACLILPPTCI